MADALKILRDIAIILAAFTVFDTLLTMKSNPDKVGYWLANVDIAYDSIWSEYMTDMADCDCGVSE